MASLDYYNNMDILSDFIKTNLKDITSIMPILNDNDPEYSKLKNSRDTDTDIDTNYDNYHNYHNKVKLKFNIIKNISDNSENKTRSYALWYYDNITEKDSNDKIAYYVDYDKDFNILMKIIESPESPKGPNTDKEKLKEIVIRLKAELMDKILQKNLINKATSIYLGPKLFLNYYFIDLMVLCGIFILSMFQLSLKPIIDVYKSGMLLLVLVIFIVCITMFFYNSKK